MNTEQNECIINDVKITLKDYRHFFFQHTLKYRPARQIVLFIVLLITCVLILFLSLSLKMNFLFYLSLITLALFLFSFVIILLMNLQVGKNFKTNKLLKDNLNYKVNNEFFEVQSINTNSKISWDKVYKVAESDRLIAVYISKAQAFLLPKHYLGENEYATFKNILKNNLDKKQLAVK
jgi:membrane glycosyltransferase